MASPKKPSFPLPRGRVRLRGLRDKFQETANGHWTTAIDKTKQTNPREEENNKYGLRTATTPSKWTSEASGVFSYGAAPVSQKDGSYA